MSTTPHPKESATMNPAFIANGTQVRLTRTLSDGRTITWTGELVGQGPMTVGGAEMGYVVLRTDTGRECFALDPAFATVVRAERRCYCPSDCHCRSDFRTTICGCVQH